MNSESQRSLHALRLVEMTKYAIKITTVLNIKAKTNIKRTYFTDDVYNNYIVQTQETNEYESTSVERIVESPENNIEKEWRQRSEIFKQKVAQLKKDKERLSYTKEEAAEESPVFGIAETEHNAYLITMRSDGDLSALEYDNKSNIEDVKAENNIPEDKVLKIETSSAKPNMFQLGLAGIETNTKTDLKRGRNKLEFVFHGKNLLEHSDDSSIVIQEEELATLFRGALEDEFDSNFVEIDLPGQPLRIGIHTKDSLFLIHDKDHTTIDTLNSMLHQLKKSIEDKISSDDISRLIRALNMGIDEGWVQMEHSSQQNEGKFQSLYHQLYWLENVFTALEIEDRGMNVIEKDGELNKHLKDRVPFYGAADARFEHLMALADSRSPVDLLKLKWHERFSKPKPAIISSELWEKLLPQNTRELIMDIVLEENSQSAKEPEQNEMEINDEQPWHQRMEALSENMPVRVDASIDEEGRRNVLIGFLEDGEFDLSNDLEGLKLKFKKDGARITVQNEELSIMVGPTFYSSGEKGKIRENYASHLIHNKSGLPILTFKIYRVGSAWMFEGYEVHKNASRSYETYTEELDKEIEDLVNELDYQSTEQRRQTTETISQKGAFAIQSAIKKMETKLEEERQNSLRLSEIWIKTNVASIGILGIAGYLEYISRYYHGDLPRNLLYLGIAGLISNIPLIAANIQSVVKEEDMENNISYLKNK